MLQGRCNCASITVSILEMPKESAICYCGNCRRAGSTPGSIIYMFNTSEVTIDDSQGALKSYRDSDTTSGNTVIRQFCSNCGCPVASLLSVYPQKIVVKAGLFGYLPKPVTAIFPQNQPQWLEVVKA